MNNRNNINPILDAIEAGDKYALAGELLKSHGVEDPTLEQVHQAIASIDSIIVLTPPNDSGG